MTSDIERRFGVPIRISRPARPFPAIGWLLLAGVGAIAALVIAFAIQTRHQVQQEAETRAQTTTHLIAEHAARLFDAADLTISETREGIAGLEWNAIESSRPLWERLRRLNDRFPYINAIWLNDTTGKLRLSTIAYPTPSSNAADRDFFKAHLTPNGDAYVSEPIRGRVTAAPTFLVSRRLEDAKGDFLGIASVTINPEYFRTFYQSLHNAEGVRITLFRMVDGSILIQEPGQPMESTVKVREALWQSVQAAQGAGTTWTDGSLIAHRHVTPWPLHVGYEVDAEIIERQWRRTILPYGVGGVLAAAALLAMSRKAFRRARAARATQELLESRVRERTASLERARDELSAALQQKQLLLGEVNHRVKNSLQLISSLLLLQAGRTTDAHVRSELNDARTRIAAVADVHERLYQTENYASVDAADLLHRLCRSVAEGQSNGTDAEIRFHAVGERLLPVHQAVPLSLIVNEMLTNAQKYAFRDRQPGHVDVVLASGLAGELIVEVRDDGVGLPSGFDPHKSSGFGMRMIAALTRQIGARLHTESASTGAKFRIELPDPQNG